MQLQRRGKVVPPKAPPVTPYVSEAELGVCGGCEGYNCFGPHQKQSDGRVKVKCILAKTMVFTRKDIESYRDCPVFIENRPHG